MRIGLNGTGLMNRVPRLLDEIERAEAEGFAAYWVGQGPMADALTVLALAGTRTTRIELGVAVVPIWPQHPQVVAASALTTQVATQDRLVLGLGLGHKPLVEMFWGATWDHPLGRMREYLDVLDPLLEGRPAAVTGRWFSSNAGVDVRSAAPPSVMLAALGPHMLELAGSRTDGTVTWCTGVATLRDHIVPTIRTAADSAGRTAPRIVASLPVLVADDVGAARDFCATVYSYYDDLPSYRAMLDREGAGGPADVALVGDEATVAGQIEELAAVGVTDFSAAELGRDAEDRDRTRSFLRSIL